MKDQASGLRVMMAKKTRERELKERATLLQSLIDSAGEMPPPRLRQILAVTSGKGGVGKSTISANLGLYFSSRGLETILMDADLGLANIDVILGVKPSGTLLQVIRGQKSLKEIIQPGPMGLKLISGASGIADLANLSETERRNLIGEIASLQYEGEILLIDTGAGLSQNVLGFLTLADQVVLIVTDEPASIADSYGVVKALSQANYQGKITVIMNRIRIEKHGRMLFHKLCATAKKFLKKDLKLAGIILDEPLVRESTQKMQPFYILSPAAEVTRNLRGIGEVVLGASEYKPDAGHSILKRLSSFFSIR
ncbi:MAG: P-loop NTPase [Candidatus Wallbacteria bacterium]|nr:P-loop NTPase [Candidatus Wallbacteria bacterium]